MPSGWGVDPTIADGVVTSGTSSEDVRKVWGALYTPGIISGCRVTTNSNMTYTISAGVVAIQTATGQVVMAPVNAVTIPTAAAPASGNRTDIIWVRQRFPGTGSDSNIVVEVGTTKPAQAQEIRRFTISAGNTSTNSATPTGGIAYSIPYGANLGVLHRFQSAHNGAIANDLRREGAGTIYLPTDRLLRFRYQGVYSAQNAVGFDNSKYCELAVFPSIDNNNFEIWTSPGLHQGWQTLYFETVRATTAGTHTVSYLRRRQAGPGTILQWYGWHGGDFWPGGIFTVEDAGPLP